MRAFGDNRGRSKSVRNEVWLFVFLVGLLAFNWPALDVFSASLPAYLFSAWLVLVAVIYLLSRTSPDKEDGGR